MLSILAKAGIGARIFVGLAAILLISAYALDNFSQRKSQEAHDLMHEGNQLSLSSVRAEAASLTASLQVDLSRAGADGSPTTVGSGLIEDWRAQLSQIAESLDELDITDSLSARQTAALRQVLNSAPQPPEATGTYLDNILMATQFQATLAADGASGMVSGSNDLGSVVTQELFRLGVAAAIIEISLDDVQPAIGLENAEDVKHQFVSSVQMLSPSLGSLDQLDIGQGLEASKSKNSAVAESVDKILQSEDFEHLSTSLNSVLNVASPGSNDRFGSQAELLKAHQKIIDLETALASDALDQMTDDITVLAESISAEESRLRLLSIAFLLVGLSLFSLPFLTSRRNEASLRKKAYTDPLTGLLNRDGLDTVVTELTPTPEAPVGLLHIDLDRFKPVNDTYGHQIGDKVLAEVAERLKAMTDVGSAGEAWAARAGGDEFIMVTQSLDEAELRTLASRIISGLEHFEFEEVTLRVGASVGIAVCVEPTDPKDLILEADLALYQAKRNGRGQSATYERTTGEFIRTVRKSIDEKRLQVAYHPQIDLITGKVVGSEALARIVAANGEVIPANRWIQIIEWMSGSEQLFEALVSSINEDVTTGARFPGRIWCNIAPHDLARHRGTHKIISLLTKTGLPPQRLGIELSESEKIENPRELAYAINSLSDAGIAVALDNFGVRNMPLGYLVQLPVQRVKLDRALLAGNHDRVAPARRVTAAVVAMANDLGIEIVAGGVENAAEIRTLRELKIGIAQGYLFGKPLEWDRNHGRPLDRKEPQNFLTGPGSLPQQTARLDSSGGL